MSRVTALLSSLILAACGARPSGPPPPPTITGQLAPASPPAARHGAGEGRPSDRGEALRGRIATEAKRISDEARRPAPALSDPLSATAEALAAASDGVTPDGESVAFAASYFGVASPVPSILVLKGEGGDGRFVDSISASLKTILRRGRYHRLGIGVAPAGAERVVVVLLQPVQVDLAPVPREAALGATLPVRGRLTDGLKAASVVATGIDGKVTPLASGAGPEFAATFTCDAPGRHKIEVMGVGARGPTVVANFPIFCGVAAPTTRAMTRSQTAGMSEAEAGALLLRLTNEERARQGLAALRPDARLAAVARAHCEDMRQHGFVGHVSPTTGSPGDRVQRARIPASVVEENVGLGTSPEEVHAGLMESPAHRGAILSAHAQTVGIGVVRRGRSGGADFFVTELFVAPPVPVDVPGARQALEAAARGGAKGRTRDGGLEAVANGMAADLASGKLKQDAAGAALGARIKGRKVQVRAVQAIAGMGSEVAPFLKDPLLGRGDLPRYGVGVAAGQRGSVPVLVVVVLLAR
ncbi:MAG: CAP domain-containing protein [bacterium]